MKRTRSFEMEIINEFKHAGYSCGLSPKSLWIRGHLLQVKEDYGSAMFKKYQSFILEARAQGAKVRNSKESTFHSTLSELRQLGLIQSSPYVWGPRKRRYYKLAPKGINEGLWHNPRLQLYRKSWRKTLKKSKPLGRRRRTVSDAS